MTDDPNPKSNRTTYGDASWWADFGPAGGAILVLLGIGGSLFLFFGGFDSEGDLVALHWAARVVAIGLVVVGTTLLARRRRADALRPNADDKPAHSETEH
ncbi:hypothetical protein ACFWIY_34260 [Streptomyces sioyaensis]|uniref:hypothetical protein n=1 Tax=Streptomyces sioyaensis TaxID=67364 RepID=UPI0036486B21